MIISEEYFEVTMKMVANGKTSEHHDKLILDESFHTIIEDDKDNSNQPNILFMDDRFKYRKI